NKAADSLAQAVSLLDKLAEEDTKEPQYRWELAQAYRGQAVVNNDVRRSAEAEQAYRRAVALVDGLIAEFPNPEYRLHAATYCVELVQAMKGYENAEAGYLEALKLLQQLVKDFPKDRWYRQELAYTLDSLGWLWEEFAKEPAKAEPWFRKALKYHEDLVAEDPTDADNRARLAKTQEHLAR